MGFRDPRILSDKVDNNITNAPSPVPDAESVPDTDRETNASHQSGTANLNNYNRLSAPPTIDDEPYSHGTETGLQFQDGTPDTNITRTTGEKDGATAPAYDQRLLNAKGAGGGSIG